MRSVIALAVLLSVASPCYAHRHVRKDIDEKPTPGFVRPYNSVLVARLDPLFPELDNDPKIGEFRAVIFRRSRRLCYQFDLTGSGTITSVRVGIGLPTTEHFPSFQLAALDSGRSGNCIKLARDAAKFLIRYPLLTYVEVATSTSPDGASRGQILRIVKNVKVKEMSGPFASAITDELIAMAGK